MANITPRYYGIEIFDEIHHYFPDILYNSQRFQNVQQLLSYIQTQVRNRVDLFRNALNSHMQTNTIYDNSPFITPHILQAPLITPRRYQVQQPSQNAMPTGTENFITNLLAGLINSDISGNDINITATFADRVPVYPTLEQIEQATSMRMATTADEGSACSICQDNFTSGQAIRKIVQCSHEYHRGCIDTWLQSNVQCPICRHDVRGRS